MSTNDNLIVPIFKKHVSPNEASSRLAGRPIFDEMEIVEIRMAGNKETVAAYPAHEVWKIVDAPDGSREPKTYAMRWPDLYQKFKANEAQVQSGTPLSEAPFLTQAKRMELKALNIHTVEALAAVDGQPLDMLGMGGREMKQQAEVYLQKASGTAIETRLAAENVDLRQQIADMQAQFDLLNKKVSKDAQPGKAARGKAGKAAQKAEEPEDQTDGVDENSDETGDKDAGDAGNNAGGEGDVSPFETWSDEDIILWIKDETGKAPKGNPNHATLVRMADEVNEELAKQAQGE